MSTEKNNDQEEKLKDQVEDILNDAIEEAEEKNETEKEENDEGLSEKDQLKEELGKEKDKFLRLFAEFENYKKRTGKERLELFKTANQDMMVAMLPILDDFDRAISEIKKTEDEELLKGVQLIQNKFRETLRAKGLEAMQINEGDDFDPEVHEAITQVPVEKKDLKGKIVDVVERGYKLGERIIRFPKVVTGK